MIMAVEFRPVDVDLIAESFIWLQYTNTDSLFNYRRAWIRPINSTGILLSGCPCVCDHILKGCIYHIANKPLVENSPDLHLDAVEKKDKLIRFWVERSGHNGTEYGQKSSLEIWRSCIQTSPLQATFPANAYWSMVCHQIYHLVTTLLAGLAWYISPYHWYISDIYPIFLFENIGYFRFSHGFLFFNVTHCDYVLIFSPCVLLAYDLPSAFSLCWTTSVRLHLSTAMKCEWQEYFTWYAKHTHTHYYLVINFTQF